MHLRQLLLVSHPKTNFCWNKSLIAETKFFLYTNYKKNLCWINKMDLVNFFHKLTNMFVRIKFNFVLWTKLFDKKNFLIYQQNLFCLINNYYVVFSIKLFVNNKNQTNTFATLRRLFFQSAMFKIRKIQKHKIRF